MCYRLKSIFLLLYLTWGVVLCVLVISFIAIISMEIRLKFLNETEYFVNANMQTNIRKNTSFHFKLYRIDFCTVGTLGNRTHATSKLAQEPTQYLNLNKQEKHILRTSLTLRIYINIHKCSIYCRRTLYFNHFAYFWHLCAVKCRRNSRLCKINQWLADHFFNILIWLYSFPLFSQRTRTRHYVPIKFTGSKPSLSVLT